MDVVGITDYGLFIVAFLILLVLPGPGNLVFMMAIGRGGFKGGLYTLLGVIVGDQIILWLATAGVAAFLISYPTAFKTLQWLGAIYLFYLGFALLKSKADAMEMKQLSGSYWQQGLLVTLLNPKAIMFYMAFFPQFIDAENYQGTQTIAIMALTVAVITCLYGFLFWLLLRLLIEPLRQRPQLVLWLKRLAGISLMFFALQLAFNR